MRLHFLTVVCALQVTVPCRAHRKKTVCYNLLTDMKCINLSPFVCFDGERPNQKVVDVSS